MADGGNPTDYQILVEALNTIRWRCDTITQAQRVAHTAMGKVRDRAFKHWRWLDDEGEKPS